MMLLEWSAPLLAHGALGYWDEGLFVGIAVIFTAFLIYSFRTSSNFDPELDDERDA